LPTTAGRVDEAAGKRCDSDNAESFHEGAGVPLILPFNRRRLHTEASLCGNGQIRSCGIDV
jgi:hypothetical protein